MTLANSRKRVDAEISAARQYARPRVRAAEFSDYQAIADLQSRNGLPTRSREDWIALWRDNPAFDGSHWTIGWILETPGGEIVGYIAAIPALYRLRGREIRAAITSSWVTDPPFRGYSMAVLNAVSRQKNIDLMLTNTASPKTEACLPMLGWSRLPVAGWDTSYFWVTNHHRFARSLLKMYSIPGADFWAYMLGPGLRGSEIFRHSREPVPDSSLTVELCPEIDGRFDRFWEELAQLKRNTLLGMRDRQTLAWHFKRSVQQGRAWILIIRRSSEVIAYAAFDLLPEDTHGFRRARLVDFQALDGVRESLSTALVWILRKLRDDRVHVLETSAAVLSILGDPAGIAPYQRKLNAWRYYYKAVNPELAEVLKDPGNWCTSHYDGDASL